MRTFLFLLLACFSLTAFSQRPSQAEINKRIKEAKAMQEQMKNDPEYGPMIKAAIDNTNEQILSTKAPKKDIARLSGISPKILSKSELAQTTFVLVPCALKVSIPLAVAKVSFDCKKAKIEGEEGLLLEAEYEFKSGNTIIGIGAGIKTNLPFVDLTAKQMGYVTFDRDGNMLMPG